jgi:hypothetical protein
MIRKSIITALLMTILLVAAAGGASAQDVGLVSTSLQYTTEDPLGPTELWNGRSMTGRIDVEYCWGAEGGFNPTGESFSLMAAPSGPSWVTLSVSPETMTISPPMGPTTEAGCERAGSIDVGMSTTELWNDQQVLVTVALIPIAEGSALPLPDDVPLPLPVPATGTFDTPGSVSAGFSFRTIPAPTDQSGNGAPGSGNTGGNTGGNNAPVGGGDPIDTGDSPGPAALLVVLFVVAAAHLRRR